MHSKKKYFFSRKNVKFVTLHAFLKSKVLMRKIIHKLNLRLNVVSTCQILYQVFHSVSDFESTFSQSVRLWNKKFVIFFEKKIQANSNKCMFRSVFHQITARIHILQNSRKLESSICCSKKWSFTSFQRTFTDDVAVYPTFYFVWAEEL